jgi:hypothetical protein
MRDKLSQLEARLARLERESKEKYPWEDCIKDQMEQYGDKETAEKVCGKIKAQSQGKKASGDDRINEFVKFMKGQLDGLIEVEVYLVDRESHGTTYSISVYPFNLNIYDRMDILNFKGDKRYFAPATPVAKASNLKAGNAIRKALRRFKHHIRLLNDESYVKPTLRRPRYGQPYYDGLAHEIIVFAYNV